MKKYLIIIAMLVALVAPVQNASARGNHVKAKKEIVDSTKQEAIEAYSDTTSERVDSLTAMEQDADEDADEANMPTTPWDELWDSMDHKGVTEMLFVLAILVIIFIFSPLIILGLILFFIQRNRKQKMKIAEMAIKSGQPIPEKLLEEHLDDRDELWKKGMRQTFLGIGLMIFLGYSAGNIGFGIGALVTAVGIGKLVIVKTSGKNNHIDDNHIS